MNNIKSQNRIKYQLDKLGEYDEYAELEPQRDNAPVTRIKWECDNLPDGLPLSEDGELSGCPTVAGSYECTVRVSTN